MATLIQAALAGRAASSAILRTGVHLPIMRTAFELVSDQGRARLCVLRVRLSPAPGCQHPVRAERASLQLWFYAIHLFATTRHGVSAKEFERQLAVPYKTAWRMVYRIRQHMADADGDEPLGGHGTHAKVDETLVSGVKKDKHNRAALTGTSASGSLGNWPSLPSSRA